MHKTRFKSEVTGFSAFKVDFACKCVLRKEILVSELVSLVVHSSMRLHVSQCFHCVKTDNVHKTCFKRKKRLLEHLTSILLEKAFKRKKMFVLELVSIILHNSMRFHVSQCFHCVKTDNVQKRVFCAK